VQQVADWLEKLGLGQYAQRFAENDISFSVLPDLTDQDTDASCPASTLFWSFRFLVRLSRAAFANSERSNRAINSGGAEPTASLYAGHIR